MNSSNHDTHQATTLATPTTATACGDYYGLPLTGQPAGARPMQCPTCEEVEQQALVPTPTPEAQTVTCHSCGTVFLRSTGERLYEMEAHAPALELDMAAALRLPHGF